MNIASGKVAAEARKLLNSYIEQEGLLSGKRCFSSHLRELERILLEEADRDTEEGTIVPRRVARSA